MEVAYRRRFKRLSSRSRHPPSSHPLSVSASGRLPQRLAPLQPSRPKPYQIQHMELTSPGAVTLRRDPDQATGGGGTGDAETADVALAASGDGRAFERLYRTHVARVHSLARRMINPDVADDVTQDVFVRAWSKLGTFRGEAAFGTWLHRLAINVILAERTALEAHLAGCEACRTTLEELRRVVARARALDDRPPAADLWPGIAEQIGVSSGAHQVVSLAERRTRRRVAFTVPQLAAAAA